MIEFCPIHRTELTLKPPASSPSEETGSPNVRGPCSELGSYDKPRLPLENAAPANCREGTSGEYALDSICPTAGDREENNHPDRATIRSLFDAEESPLLRFAFSLVGRRVVAEELVQEAFLQLFAQWESVHSHRAWLYQTVRNRAYNHLRDNQREVLRDDPDGQSARLSDITPEVQILQLETRATLRNLLKELDVTDQRLVHLKYFENLVYQEISVQTGLSVGNVGYRLHHILKGLANRLRQLGIDGNS